MPASNARCSGTGMHRAVFPDMTQGYDHHPNKYETTEKSTMGPPVRPVQCIMGDIQMNAMSATHFHLMDTAFVKPMGAECFDDAKVELVETRPVSKLPSYELNFKHVLNTVHGSFESIVRENSPIARPERSRSEDDQSPPELLSNSHLHQTEESTTQNVKQLEASTSQELKKHVHDHLSSCINSERTKLALRGRPDLREVEDPMPTRYQQNNFIFDEHEPVHCDRVALSPLVITDLSPSTAETDMIRDTTFHSRILAQEALPQPSSSSCSPSPTPPPPPPPPGVTVDTDPITTFGSSPITVSWEFVNINPPIPTTTSVQRTTTAPSPSPPPSTSMIGHVAE